MKYLLIGAVLLLAACRTGDKSDNLKLGTKALRQHETAINALVQYVNGGQPAIIENVDYYEVDGRPFVMITYRNTATGQLGNLLVEGPSAVLEEAVIYYCIGSCTCYITGSLDPQGNYVVKCTCTDCLMVVHQHPQAANLFEQ